MTTLFGTHQSDSVATLVEGASTASSADTAKTDGAAASEGSVLVAAVAAAAAAAAIVDAADAAAATASTECSNNNNSARADKKDAPRPRRRLKETLADHADGLAVLIQKTKAISIQQEDLNLLPIGEDESSWLRALYSNDADQCLWGLRKIRKYVCGDGSEVHAQNLISWNALSRLLWLLQPSLPESILFETLWILTNIAAGPTAHTTAIVQTGFLPFLVALLSHPRGAVRTQASWVVGNIVGDREGFRDLVLREGTLQPLLRIWEGEFPDETARKEAFRIAMWVVDNMCRYKPDWHQMAPAFEMLPNVLAQQDPFLLKECCWAIARILHQSGRHPAIDNMITEPLCYRLIEILGYNNMLTTHPILRALINLASSKNPMHLQHIIEAGLLDHLDLLLTEHFIPKSCRASLQIFVMQVLGNIASHQKFAPCITNMSSLVTRMMEILGGRGDHELRHEACYCVRNLAFHRNTSITREIVDRGALEALVEITTKASPDSKVLLAAVEAIGTILQAPAKEPVMDEMTSLSVGHGTWVVTSKSDESRVVVGDASEAGDHADTRDESNSVDVVTGSPHLPRLHALGGFDVLVETLVRVTGHDLDQMDEDGMNEGLRRAASGGIYQPPSTGVSGHHHHHHHHGTDDGGDSDDSDDDDNECNTGRGPSAKKTQSTPILTMRQTIAARIHRMLVLWFSREFHERVLAAHMATEVLTGLGVLTVAPGTLLNGVGGAGDAMHQLAQDFRGMLGEAATTEVKPVHTKPVAAIVLPAHPVDDTPTCSVASTGNKRGVRSMFST